MPYFRLYDKEKLDKVLDTLSTRFFHVRGRAENPRMSLTWRPRRSGRKPVPYATARTARPLPSAARYGLSRRICAASP